MAAVVVRLPEGHAQSQTEDKNVAAVRAVIEAQAAAWNRGDVAGYMEGYAKEETTTFVSGDSVTRGWQTVHDRYKSRYDTREKMGTLAFSELEFKPLSEFYFMASAAGSSRAPATRRTAASHSSSAAPTPAGASSTTTRLRSDG